MSLTSTVEANEWEHGRSYHSYRPGQYMLPNDATEQDRIDQKYHSLNLVFDGKLFFAPIGKPTEILDIGTGTGIWAIDVADAYPNAKVTGTDLSPIQPTWVPPNVNFQVDDCQLDWTFKTKFDLIHTLCMTGCIKDWDHLFQQAFAYATYCQSSILKYLTDTASRATKPGGYIECQEISYVPSSQDGSLTAASVILQWHSLQTEGVEKAGLDLTASGTLIKERMERVGYVNATIKELALPIGRWPADPTLKAAGLHQLCAMVKGLTGISLRIFTKSLGWSVEEMEILLEKVRAEWKNPSIHSYWPV